MRPQRRSLNVAFDEFMGRGRPLLASEMQAYTDFEGLGQLDRTAAELRDVIEEAPR